MYVCAIAANGALASCYGTLRLPDVVDRASIHSERRSPRDCYRRRVGSTPGTPGWRNRHRTALERVAIERVVRHLEGEGREVQGLWFPDLAQLDPKIDGRRPVDAALEIDGRPAAIEVTRFLSAPRAAAMVRAHTLRGAVERRLRDDDLQFGFSFFAIYEPGRLLAVPMGQLTRESSDLASIAVAAVSGGSTLVQR